MAYITEKENAIILRKRGKSISQIAAELQMQKSTVSVWCRDIALSPSQLHALEMRQKEKGLIGSLRAAETKRLVRIAATKSENEKGAKDVGHVTKRDLFMLGIGLYWGEGYKKGSGECGFTNKDPHIIRAFLLWIESAYQVRPKDLILRVSINTHFRNQNERAMRYWSRITKVPLSQFTRTSFIKTPLQKNYPNNRAYYGTVRIKIRRATALHRRILGSLEYLATALAAQEI